MAETTRRVFLGIPLEHAADNRFNEVWEIIKDKTTMREAINALLDQWSGHELAVFRHICSISDAHFQVKRSMLSWYTFDPTRLETMIPPLGQRRKYRWDESLGEWVLRKPLADLNVQEHNVNICGNTEDTSTVTQTDIPAIPEPVGVKRYLRMIKDAFTQCMIALRCERKN